MENNSNNPSNQNRSWEDQSQSNQGYDSTSQSQSQGNQNWNYQPTQSKLPADNSSMVLAIIATVVFVICCCFGGPIFAFVLSLIGFILAYVSVNTYQNNPEHYSPQSLKRVTTAKTFNLVVAIISLLIIMLGAFDIFGNILDSDSIFEKIMKGEDDWYYEGEETEVEESDVEDDWYEYEEEADSLKQEIDTIQIEETVIEVIEPEVNKEN